jgi:hypothetical protein
MQYRIAIGEGAEPADTIRVLSFAQLPGDIRNHIELANHALLRGALALNKRLCLL